MYKDSGKLKSTSKHLSKSLLKKAFINNVMNLIPIDRKIDGVRSFPIKDTLTLCKSFMNYNKRCLIFFPEGTRGKPGEITPFKRGASTFSINLNKPIVPAVIFGSHRAWPKDKFLMQPGKICVYILEPIYPSSFIKTESPTNEEVNKAIKGMTLELEQRIKEKAEFLYE